MDDDDVYKLKVLKERAATLAKPVHNDKTEGKLMNCIGFLLSDEQYFIDEGNVLEVIPLMELTPLPCTPDFILGIINVRGKILSVVNLKDFLNLPAKGITNLNKVIVVKQGEIELGLLVDEVNDNVKINFNQLQQGIASFTDVQMKYFVGITENQSIVFDIVKFLGDKEIMINDII